MRGGERLVEECGWMRGRCSWFYHPTEKSKTFTYRCPSSVMVNNRFRSADYFPCQLPLGGNVINLRAVKSPSSYFAGISWTCELSFEENFDWVAPEPLPSSVAVIFRPAAPDVVSLKALTAFQQRFALLRRWLPRCSFCTCTCFQDLHVPLQSGHDSRTAVHLTYWPGTLWRRNPAKWHPASSR